MLRDVVHELLLEGERIESPLIWESTRFCVTKSAGAEITSRRLNRATGAILAGIVEIGQMAGLLSAASVYDAIMQQVLASAGCLAHIVGVPKRIGKAMTYAGLFAIDDAMLGRIREASGIDGPVLSRREAEGALAAWEAEAVTIGCRRGAEACHHVPVVMGGFPRPAALPEVQSPDQDLGWAENRPVPPMTSFHRASGVGFTRLKSAPQGVQVLPTAAGSSVPSGRSVRTRF